MAKSFAVAVLLVAFCFSSSALARLVPEDDTFTVEGKVYCDPCRFEFETRLSHPLSNIKVTLECKKIGDEKNITYLVEGQTDKNGFYSLPVKGDHQEEFCEVKTEKSTHAKCKEPMKKMDVDRIALTKNNGVSSSIRFINPLGFMTRNIDARCVSVAQELGMLVSLNDQHDN
ncbi:hypothetical protein HN51_044170 [Arachis hypogaea]|uniref:Olee1-like protein n=1 Tax=Arachis hypogaea TaxID=3818 RepID=A0A444Y3S1_ARAHY|nr:olee1-like protein [Arachis ipaensis]XP_016169632.1 olee1-like protein [Arachis ipaensis]XP_025669230.1 olee1-like protein [Arachis hypogaea]XP_025669245.1 olee1-like protein [Arachis hypogaea]XP_057724124.1 olee1-like protein [Arachis stenosperma]QHN96346.1 Olee1-like protein [Arachis hypogaea]QHN96347.1 Olee1-like protein [Arachis hypogaea]RYQ96566.1 hypothetical protein Ahy_B08g092363 [Arachis hypogaea]RYQ96567.1 hypothetical protein Ahy_B08g092365 [Arachis hypogaea]